MQKGDDSRGGQSIWTVGNFSFNSGQLGGTAARNTFRASGVVMEMEKMGKNRTTDLWDAGILLMICSVNISDYRSFNIKEV